MSAPNPKRQKTADADATYTLLYHPGIPGRGEHVRLAFAAAQTPFADPANSSGKGAASAVYAACAPGSLGQDGNPPAMCPPMLRVAGAGKAGKDLLLSQTGNILLYLGRRLGLAGADDDVDGFHVHGLALTALDWNDEAHDTHHPVAVAAYYEDQKDEALRRTREFREARIPKFLGYFERVLKGNESGAGRYLVGEGLTYADTTLWQVLDGLKFAFPKEMEARAEEFPMVCRGFYDGVKEEEGIKKYLASEKRLEYSNGIFRHYPELDRQ